MFEFPNDEFPALTKEHAFFRWPAQAKINPLAVKRAKGMYLGAWTISAISISIP